VKVIDRRPQTLGGYFRLILADGRVMQIGRGEKIRLAVNRGPHAGDWVIESFRVGRDDLDHFGAAYLAEDCETLTKIQSMRWILTPSS
jgi:hypothetical protein